MARLPILALAALLFAAPAVAEPVTLVALGDSLTAGYGLPPGQGFPAQLERALRAEGLDVTVADAGVSGDTTSGGLERLDWSVGPEADAVILELGANDGLRGLPPETMRANLVAMLDKLDARGLPVLLAGMYAPGNYGPKYAQEFRAVFADLARRDVVFYEFFLDGVAETANQAFDAATRIVDLFKQDRERITAESERAGSALRIHDLMQQNPFVTSNQLVERTGLPSPTVNAALADLERLGIVEEVTGRKRGRVFGYRRYLAILSEGTDPLPPA